jgi:ParB family chromosome partitioning protein
VVSQEIHFIDVSLIDHNPWQPRGEIDPVTLQELADDIKLRCYALPDTFGLMQPPSVRHHPSEHERYQLLFGHRRLEAFRLLAGTHPQYAYMPVIVVNVDDTEMISAAWHENVQRQDMTIIEEADYIVRLMDDYGWTLRETSELLGIPGGTLSNTIRLAKLPAGVKAQLSQAKASRAVCLELLRLSSFETPEAQALLADAASMRWSQVKQRVDNINKAGVRGEVEMVDAYDELVTEAAHVLSEALLGDVEGAWQLLLRVLGERDRAADVDEARLEVSKRVLRKAVGRVRGQDNGRAMKRALADALNDADLEPPWNRRAMQQVDTFLRWRTNGQHAGKVR